MKLIVNGSAVELSAKSKLGKAIADQPYQPGSLIAIVRSTGETQKETNDFELITSKGSIVLQLNQSEFASEWRKRMADIKERGVRWRTSKVYAIGSFPSNLEVDRNPHYYSRYDCFFALGGFDNSTTYFMIAKTDHTGQYGSNGGVFGRITKGRHILRHLDEGDRILDIRPVILTLSQRDAFVTDDLNLVVEDGMTIETFVQVDLEKRSPVSSEHFLVTAGNGILPITDRTFTYSACSTRMDVSLVPEFSGIREEDLVTVRHEGTGTGRIYFYRQRRQVSPSHNIIGRVVKGSEILQHAPAGSDLTIVSNPIRVMTIGMTQKDAGSFLEKFGLSQSRQGLTDDNAIVVEQEPELTMEALEDKNIDTLGVQGNKISEWALDDKDSPKTAHYLRKMTGLDHKPVGTLKVFFTYPDMPMITFEGNPKEAAGLLPEKNFEPESVRGQIGVTNMSRPNRGMIGIRLEGSQEFGPTGEEPYGTNIVGRILSDLPALMEGLKDGDIIYIRESRPEAKSEKKRREAK